MREWLATPKGVEVLLSHIRLAPLSATKVCCVALEDASWMPEGHDSRLLKALLHALSAEEATTTGATRDLRQWVLWAVGYITADAARAAKAVSSEDTNDQLLHVICRALADPASDKVLVLAALQIACHIGPALAASKNVEQEAQAKGASTPYLTKLKAWLSAIVKGQAMGGEVEVRDLAMQAQRGLGVEVKEEAPGPEAPAEAQTDEFTAGQLAEPLAEHLAGHLAGIGARLARGLKIHPENLTLRRASLPGQQEQEDRLLLRLLMFVPELGNSTEDSWGWHNVIVLHVVSVPVRTVFPAPSSCKVAASQAIQLVATCRSACCVCY